MYAVVLRAVGIPARHPVLLLGFLFVVSMTFVMIMHALASRFGAIGKFLGLVFMVVQLVSAGGTFPWQTLPMPLHPVHHALPMSYAVDGIRHLMYGGSLANLTVDLLVLALYLLGAFLFSTRAARKAGNLDCPAHQAGAVAVTDACCADGCQGCFFPSVGSILGA